MAIKLAEKFDNGRSRPTYASCLLSPYRQMLCRTSKRSAPRQASTTTLRSQSTSLTSVRRCPSSSDQPNECGDQLSNKWVLFKDMISASVRRSQEIELFKKGQRCIPRMHRRAVEDGYYFKKNPWIICIFC